MTSKVSMEIRRVFFHAFEGRLHSLKSSFIYSPGMVKLFPSPLRKASTRELLRTKFRRAFLSSGLHLPSLVFLPSSLFLFVPLSRTSCSIPFFFFIYYGKRKKERETRNNMPKYARGQKRLLKLWNRVMDANNSLENHQIMIAG